MENQYIFIWKNLFQKKKERRGKMSGIVGIKKKFQVIVMIRVDNEGVPKVVQQIRYDSAELDVLYYFVRFFDGSCTVIPVKANRIPVNGTVYDIVENLANIYWLKAISKRLEF